MKLSLVFELLLIFVLLAFAASKSVKKTNKKAIQNKNSEEKQEENGINKFCKCSEALCNCCREFAVPYVNLDGPGCASVMYLEGDKLSVSLSFGKKVISNRTISGRKASPVCMPMPGGVSKFCGRIYNIGRSGEDFRACLGLELQSKNTVEAAVRVSCFKFGEKGVNLEHPDPLPLVEEKEPEPEEDDDDDDDDDDEDFDLDDDDDDLGVDDDDGDLEGSNDVESADYTGFSLLDEDILGDIFGSSGGKKPNKNKPKEKSKEKITKKNKNKKQAPTTKPTTTTTTSTTKRPRPSRRPGTRRPQTVRPVRTTTVRTTTVRVRPVNRRPTRRPASRPNRRRTTTSTTSTISTPLLSVATSELTTAAPSMQTTPQHVITNEVSEQTYEPVVIVTQKPIVPTKTVTDFEDSGIEMSLAQLTGQLAAMPVTPMLANTNKNEGKMTTVQDMNYEKVEMVTARLPSTILFDTSSEHAMSSEADKDDMVQIVSNLDSSSAEHKETMAVDESRAIHHFLKKQKEIVTPSDVYSGIVLPKKKARGIEFGVEDLDVLDLTSIGTSVGQQLGLFGKNKKGNKNKNKDKDCQKDDAELDYSILAMDPILDTGLEYIDRKQKGRRQSRRQNKMMRGDWS